MVSSSNKFIINNLRFPSVSAILLLPLVGIALFYYFFTNVALYLTISLILTSILRTPVNYLSHTRFYSLRIPRPIAVLISIIGFLGLVGVFMFFFVPLVINQLQALDSFDKLVKNLNTPLQYVEEALRSVLGKKNIPNGVIVRTLEKKFNTFFSTSGQNLNLLLNLLSLSGSFVIGLLAVLFTTFYFLGEQGKIKRYFISLIPNRFFEVSITAIHKIERMLSNYLFGLLIQTSAIFTCTSVGLALIGVHNALMISLFAALVNVVPFIGPLTGTIFGLLVVITTTTLPVGSQAYAYLIFKTLAVYGIVHLLDNVVFQPFIFSQSVKAHPLEIFLIIFVGAHLGGIVGMIVAIPVYTTIKISIVEFLRGYKKYKAFQS